MTMSPRCYRKRKSTLYVVTTSNAPTSWPRLYTRKICNRSVANSCDQKFPYESLKTCLVLKSQEKRPNARCYWSNWEISEYRLLKPYRYKTPPLLTGKNWSRPQNSSSNKSVAGRKPLKIASSSRKASTLVVGQITNLKCGRALLTTWPIKTRKMWLLETKQPIEVHSTARVSHGLLRVMLRQAQICTEPQMLGHRMVRVRTS